MFSARFAPPHRQGQRISDSFTEPVYCQGRRVSRVSRSCSEVGHMNMEQNPTLAQLRTLIAACNDRAAHHVLWVAKNGEVHLSPVPEDTTPVGFAEAEPEMQLRWETFQAGNE